jgi:hypothetical protein
VSKPSEEVARIDAKKQAEYGQLGDGKDGGSGQGLLQVKLVRQRQPISKPARLAAPMTKVKQLAVAPIR